jgi:N-acetylmuramoyl-L-alanine amidase
MRIIKNIAIHCSATREGQAFTGKQIADMHMRPKAKGGHGWSVPGYAYVIELDGDLVQLVGEDKVTNGVGGHNAHTLNICYIGGIGRDGVAKDTRTPAQIATMESLVKDVLHRIPGAALGGHRDFSPDLDRDGKVESHEWMKQCPCFDVQTWAKSVGITAPAIAVVRA